MRRMRHSMKCQCGVSTGFEFRKLKPFESLALQVKCASCESLWEFKVKPFIGRRSAHEISHRCLVVSEKMKAIVDAHQKTPSADKDAAVKQMLADLRAGRGEQHG